MSSYLELSHYINGIVFITQLTIAMTARKLFFDKWSFILFSILFANIFVSLIVSITQ